jgi:DNA-binding response OmpR family regulator
MARLLIIDCEESCCQFLEHVFSKKGHVVETVFSREAGKRKIESGDFDDLE